MNGLRIVGNPYHVATLSSIIENDLDCRRLAEEIRVFYHIGGWIKLKTAFTWFNAFAGRMVVHWIGSDVLELANFSKHLKQRKRFRNIIRKEALQILFQQITHFAGAPWLAQELQTVGVQAKYIPLPLRLPKAYIGPLPDKPTFIVYMPEGREIFYGWEHVVNVASRYRWTTWHIIAHSGTGLSAPDNVIFHGWVPRDSTLELLKGSTALVRLVEHDGLSYSVLEALTLSRYVIWTYKFPHCIHSYKNNEDLERAIEEVLTYREPNVAGSLYVRETFDTKRIALQLLNALKEIAR